MKIGGLRIINAKGRRDEYRFSEIPNNSFLSFFETTTQPIIVDDDEIE